MKLDLLFYDPKQARADKLVPITQTIEADMMPVTGDILDMSGAGYPERMLVTDRQFTITSGVLHGAVTLRTV